MGDSSGVRRLDNFCVKSFTELSLGTSESPLQNDKFKECTPL